jgi:DHA1 family bicyclomycin/chloramphenicol resistance-like MFS transporter
MSQTIAQQEGEQASKLTFIMFLILGAIGALTPLAIDMYLPAMPTIAKNLGVEAGSVQFTLSVYTAGFAIGQLLHGPLADSFGRKPVMVIGILGYATASLGCAMADNIESLTLLRCAQGFAGAAPAVVIQALIRDMFDREDFARTMSFVTLVVMIAPLIAPMLGGHLAEWFGWRSIFWVLALFAAIVTTAIVWKIPETLRAENRQPLRLKTTLRNYFKLFFNKGAMGLMMAGGFSFGGMFTFLTAGSFVYIDLYGLDATEFSYLFAVNIVFMVAMTILNGRIVKKVGSIWMLRFGLTIQLVAGVGLVIVGLTGVGLWGLVPFVAMYISTLSTIGSNTMGLLLSGYPAIAGTASSLAGTLRFGTGSLLGALVALLPSDTEWTMIAVMASCALLSAATYWIFGRRENE